jgi:hypothetical protein
MVVSVGYCPDCNAKIVLSIPDARILANLYADEESKAGRLLKIIKKNRY